MTGKPLKIKVCLDKMPINIYKSIWTLVHLLTWGSKYFMLRRIFK